jgi:hypothetical protein
MEWVRMIEVILAEDWVEGRINYEVTEVRMLVGWAIEDREKKVARVEEWGAEDEVVVVELEEWSWSRQRVMEDGRMSWSKELRGEVKREEIEANKVGAAWRKPCKQCSCQAWQAWHRLTDCAYTKHLTTLLILNVNNKA